MSGTVVLVTGGAGYAGSHTVLVLLQGGYDVVVLDSCVNCTAPQSGSSPLPPSLQRVSELCGRAPVFYRVSMEHTCTKDLANVFKKHRIDGVIHFAALKAAQESVRLPIDYYDNNLRATMALAECMEGAGVRKLVYSSSSTVYGIPQYLPMDERHPVGKNITSTYGQTKFMCEKILTDFTESNKLWKVAMLRYVNPVGAHSSGTIGEDPISVPNNLVPIIAQVAAKRRDKLSIYGGDYETPDGTGVRDYIHVMDLAEGHVSALKLLLSPDFSGCRAFNLGTGQGVSVLEMVHAFEEFSKRPVPYEIVNRRAGDCAKIVVSCDRAERELGWKATRTLQAMCEDSWRWQSQNPDGYAAATGQQQQAA